VSECTVRVGRATWTLVAAVVTAGLTGAPALASTPTPPPTAAPTTTAAPDTSFLRAQAEAALVEAYPGVTAVACAVPPADTAGARFACYGVDESGAVLHRQATVNDDGGIEFSTPQAQATTTTVPSSFAGTESRLVEVPAITGPTLVAVTHAGTGPLIIQPQHGAATVGPPLTTPPDIAAGRYVVGFNGTISAFTVTTDGDWTLAIEPPTSALPLADVALSVDQPDVVTYPDTTGFDAVLEVTAAGPYTATVYTAAGPVLLAEDDGPGTAALPLPPGPGLVAIDGAAWTLARGTAPPTATAVG
jgi:hypothetical protein